MAEKPRVALIMPQETRDRVLDPADLIHLESFAEVVMPPDEQLTTPAGSEAFAGGTDAVYLRLQR